jgi:hypothetical protein
MTNRRRDPFIPRSVKLPPEPEEDVIFHEIEDEERFQRRIGISLFVGRLILGLALLLLVIGGIIGVFAVSGALHP